MALAVCLLFDAEGERTIRRLWAQLEARGIPSPLTHTHRRHHPHLSLAVARSWDFDRVFAAVSTLPAGREFRLSFQGTVCFPRGRAALAAAVSADLVQRQEAAARALADTGADMHYNYLPGHWIPHVSIATGGNANRLSVVATTVNDMMPLGAAITHAALIDSGTGQTWPLPRLV